MVEWSMPLTSEQTVRVLAQGRNSLSLCHSPWPSPPRGVNGTGEFNSGGKPCDGPASRPGGVETLLHVVTSCYVLKPG